MTREEAIAMLRHCEAERHCYDGIHGNCKRCNKRIALDMAIEALKNKSRPFGDCSKCIHTYGTLGCCTTVSNEWVYDCEHGMEQYKSTKAEPQKKYPTEWCEQCTLWEDNKCVGVATCKSNIKISREGRKQMKVKELIVRLLDEPMDAEIRLCTDYDKEEVVETHGCVSVVNRGVIFRIDEIEHWTNDCININFTDWRKNE